MGGEQIYPVEKTMIDGVDLQELKIISTPGGDVLRMLRGDSPLMPKFPSGFGEIYFSRVEPGAIKAWKLHKMQNQLFAVPAGQIKIVMYDARADSNTIGTLVQLYLGAPDNYKLLRIPAGIWYGFQGISHDAALICNCADLPHDPEECMRLPADDPSVPYSWKTGGAV